MMGGLNQDDILALIEDELNEDAAAHLRRELARHPGALELVERMRADRASLRGRPTPQLRRDLVAELEPVIARSMLLGVDRSQAGPTRGVKRPRAGSYRARHRRRLTSAVSRLTLAAGFVLVLGSGAFIVFNMLMGPDGGSMVADADEADASITDADGSAVAAADPSDGLQAEGPVHHWDATDVPDSALAGRGDATDTPAAESLLTLRSGDPAVESGLALDVRADVAAVLARAGKVIDDLERGTLVRNFTLDEVADAWNRAAMVEQERREIERLRRFASSNGPDGRLTERYRGMIQRTQQRMDVQLGELLAGRREFEAPAVQQVSFVERGASHALTLPAEHLLPLLEMLNEAFGQRIALRPLKQTADQTPPPAPTDLWQRWKDWREAIDTLDFTRDADGNLMVILPIITE